MGVKEFNKPNLLFIMKKNLRFILMILFLVSYGYTYSQEITVSGMVTDENNQPLPGVSVIIKNASKGTTTDFDGNFSIVVNSNQDVLVFSYVGYKNQEVLVSNQTKLSIVLKTDLVGLDEVVVVGYGTMKKSDLTGAVAQVKGEVFENYASNQPLQAMQGRVAGVNITKSSGQPGAGLKVRIRGVGSTNNSDPLYVIDGIPSGNNMDWVAPEDIQNVEVLKDASSTAIYGNRGANGVILVTTKSGKASNKPIFSFNSYYGVGEVPNQVDLLNASQQGSLILEAAGNDGISIPSDLETRINYVLVNNSVGTNWQDEIFRTASQNNYNLSVRGGFQDSNNSNRSLLYSISGTYFNEEGLMENTDFEKYLLDSKLDFQFNSWIKAGMNINLFHRGNGGVPQGLYSGPVPLSITTSPMDRGVDSEGNFISTSTAFGQNPLYSIYEIQFSDNTTDSYSLRSWLDINIAEGLDFKSTINLSKGFTHNKNYAPSYYLNENFYRTDSELYEGRGEWASRTWINVLNYNKTWSDTHKLIGTLGQESTFNENDGFSGVGINVPEDSDLRYLNLASSYKESLGAWQGQSSTQSYFARAFYSFKNKYMITGTVRFDGSSKFSGDNKWGTFPSFGASWKMDEEDFIQNLNVFSALKLRLGWGQVGNEASAQAGSDVANIGNYGMYYVFNGIPYKGGTATNIPTPDLRWEVIQTTNIGLDLGFLDGDLSITADYFIKDTEDMITRVSLPGYYPKDKPNANIGTMSNKGFEFSANYGKVYEKFKFNVGTNFTVIDNEVVKLNSDTNAYLDGGYIDKLGYTTRTEKGHEIAYFYGYQTNGIFKSQDQLDAYINAEGNPIQPDAKVGDIIFIDNNGNGLIDADDRAKLGSGTPDFSYGFNFSMGYKGFDFSGDFFGVSGVELVNGMGIFALEVKDYSNAYASRMDRFHPINNPLGTEPRVTLSDNNNNTRFSDRYVENGSYFKLKNLQVGYTLPSSVYENSFFTKVRFYVSGQNLFTITDYSGYDPEFGDLTHDASSDNSSLGIGVDLGNYPQPRYYYFGVNVTF